MALRYKLGVSLLVIAAAIFIFTAVAHLSCIYFGPQCYVAQMAPDEIVQSAKAGTWLAPVGTCIVAMIFCIFACYALSGAQTIRTLPLLKIGIYGIAIACVIRGLLPIQLWLRHPQKVSDNVLIVGLVWLFVGLCYYFGYRAVQSSAQLDKPK